MTTLDRLHGCRPTPRTIAAAFMVVVTLPAVVVFPLVEFQRHFWMATVVTLVLGDSVTTGLLGKYGLEEQEVGFTRWACGAEPSMVCSFVTRGIIFVVAFGVYTAIVWTEVGLQFHLVAVSVLTLPLILAVGGLAATVLNGYAIISAARRGASTESQ